jgi:hypothetical protein
MPDARRYRLEVNRAIRDHSGQALAYVYFEDEPGRRSAAKLLTRRTRRGGSRRISPSCRSYYAERNPS